MKIRPVCAGFLSLILGCARAAETAPIQSGSQPADWAQLQKLLQSCTGLTTEPLLGVETKMLSDAPLLGNGEVGVMVESDANRLSFYVGRTDFRRYALGGVDVVVKPDQDADVKAPQVRHEQDIERAEIRSKLVLGGRNVETTAWLVPDLPLMICTLRNASDQPLPVEINTWSKSPLNNMGNPFRLKAGHMNTYPYNFALNDRNGEVVYGKPANEKAGWWRYVKTGDLYCLKNEATGRYMSIPEDNKVITVAEPDKSANFRPIKRGDWVQWAANGRYLNAPYDRRGDPFPDPTLPVPVLATGTSRTLWHLAGVCRALLRP